jgi:hypothetical protein
MINMEIRFQKVTKFFSKKYLIFWCSLWQRLSLKQGTGNPGIGESDKNFIGFKLKCKFRVKSSDTPQLQMLRYVPALALVLLRPQCMTMTCCWYRYSKSNLNSLFSRTTRMVKVMKNIIRREQSTNSATFTNKVLLKYSFRLSVVQIYLWSSVLVSKTTLS